ncbi:hypothetical protein GCM10025794_35800 [Massilia kyonggiensis]
MDRGETQNQNKLIEQSDLIYNEVPGWLIPKFQIPSFRENLR